jgi:hypothetical protein
MEEGGIHIWPTVTLLGTQMGLSPGKRGILTFKFSRGLRHKEISGGDVCHLHSQRSPYPTCWTLGPPILNQGRLSQSPLGFLTSQVCWAHACSISGLQAVWEAQFLLLAGGPQESCHTKLRTSVSSPSETEHFHLRLEMSEGTPSRMGHLVHEVILGRWWGPVGHIWRTCHLLAWATCGRGDRKAPPPFAVLSTRS